MYRRIVRIFQNWIQYTRITVMYRIMLASIHAHFFIYVYDIQPKVTKSKVFNVDLVTFVCLFKQKQTRGNSFAF
jgi:hypothetical protein